MAVAHGAAGNPTQHIATPLVARDDAVHNEKGAGPNVVGNDPQAWLTQVGHGRRPTGRSNQLLKQIDFII
jgi:hypothetical protein